MAKITGGRLVAKFAKAEGISAVFTLSGGHVMDIYNGCAEEGIQIIDVRHEQSAAHAADAWTRLTGFPGIAVVTSRAGSDRCRYGNCKRLSGTGPDASDRWTG